MRWAKLLLVIAFAALTFGGSGSFECHTGSHHHDHEHFEESN